MLQKAVKNQKDINIAEVTISMKLHGIMVMQGQYLMKLE